MSGGRVEGDGVAEGLELGDEPAGLAFGVLQAGEVAGAEVVAGLCGGQDVPGDECDMRSHMVRVDLADWGAGMT